MRAVRYGCIILLIPLLTACGAPQLPQGVLRADEATLKVRHTQSRTFDTQDEKTILSASAALLQDMGYTINKSETTLGLITADKNRETDNKSQRVLANTLMVLNALNGTYDRSVYDGVDQKQRIKVSLVTKPIFNQQKTAVRVTFQRLVWDMNGRLHKLETLIEPEIYQGFFNKLSKAVFLEAHQL